MRHYLCKVFQKNRALSLITLKIFLPIAFIARYGQPLLAKKQESQITGKEKKHVYDTDHYFNSLLGRRTSHLASQ
jgi:hypothetical protein